MIKVTPEIQNLIDKGAIFYASHSGGKDSQAMYAELKEIIPFDQLVVVHADLGEVEWMGVIEHIEANVAHPVNVVYAAKGKTFLGMVEARGMWPSSAHRQCTSDLKRDPIHKFIRHDLAARGATIGVNCTGIRAEESAARSKKNSFCINNRLSIGARTVYEWMPIFDISTTRVFKIIEAAGQKPFWAYAKNERLSCVFCIMGSKNDLKHGAEQNPELFKKYVDLEKKIGHTMFMKAGKPISLEEHIGISV